MATSSDPIVGIITQGDSPLLYRYVTVPIAGAVVPLLRAHLAPNGIAFRVYDHQAGEVTDGPVLLDIPSVVADTIPTTGVLSGMNFSFTPNDLLARGNRRYRVQVTFTLTGLSTFTRTWVLWTENTVG
jgi:hypothetical protein